MPRELWDAFTAPTNVGGTMVALGLLADSLVQSLPLRWHVTMQRGVWELYDENATLRIRKFGKAAIGQRRIPPRLVLRARGAKLNWMWQAGARVGSNSTRFPAAGAKTVSDALRIVKADTMKLISKDAFDALKFRARLGGTAVGLALSTLPQAYVDARDSGLLEHQDAAHWQQFAVAEARSHSANLAGFAAGVLAGAALASIGTTTAPVIIVASLIAGAFVQSGINAWGWSDEVGNFVQSTFFSR